MAASISMVLLGTSAFAWSEGSPYLEENDLMGSGTTELIVGLFGFFGGITMFLWEFVRVDIRKKRAIPVRTIIYLCMGIPCFFTIPTALAGVLWLNTTIFSGLSWKKGEEYERKKKRAYSDKEVKSPKEKLLDFFNPIRIKESITDKCIEIQMSIWLRKKMTYVHNVSVKYKLRVAFLKILVEPASVYTGSFPH